MITISVSWGIKTTSQTELSSFFGDKILHTCVDKIFVQKLSSLQELKVIFRLTVFYYVKAVDHIVGALGS